MNSFKVTLAEGKARWTLSVAPMMGWTDFPMTGVLLAHRLSHLRMLPRRLGTLSRGVNVVGQITQVHQDRRLA
jgi:tRNA-dihydrouridine synthase